MTTRPTSTVAGIDIGGDKKGSHLVILRGTVILCNFNDPRPEHLLQQCLEHDVLAVGIDAPCAWGTEAGGRLAEKELARQGIFCFATPLRERAMSNINGFYGWMFNGERMYQTFSPTYPLLTTQGYGEGRVSFETFPHAITCAMLGKEASAKRKRVERRLLLERQGIDTDALKSIDAIDAALCALTAGFLLEGKTHAYGDASAGYIRVPALAR